MKETPSGIPRREIAALVVAYVLFLALALLCLDSIIKDTMKTGYMTPMRMIFFVMAPAYLVSTIGFFAGYYARDTIWRLRSMGYDHTKLTLEDYDKPELAFARGLRDFGAVLWGVMMLYLVGYAILLWLAEMAVYGITNQFGVTYSVLHEPWVVIGVMAMASIFMYCGDRILARYRLMLFGVSHAVFFNSLLRLALDMPPVLIVSGFLWGPYWWVVLLMFAFQFGIFVWNTKRHPEERSEEAVWKPSSPAGFIEQPGRMDFDKIVALLLALSACSFLGTHAVAAAWQQYMAFAAGLLLLLLGLGRWQRNRNTSY